MPAFDYSASPYPIRADIPSAYEAYWDQLAKPGSWWTGAQRVAIAQASRDALECDFCVERKAALSPYALQGEHVSSGSATSLPTAAIDAVHRIITDQSRITRKYVEDNAHNGLSKEAYVELVGVVVTTFSIDEFNRALGIDVAQLPTPQAGEPDQYRPAVVSEDIGFVPTVPADGAVGNEADLFPGRAPNVLRALTLVPQSFRDWRSVADAQYMPFASMANFVQIESRSINRMQTELIAGRVSAINECFY